MSRGWSIPSSFAEEALLANWDAEGLGADGVVTGLALIGGRKVCLMANDPTVKAGSWGPKTVEKILRIQERALSLELPMIYLVDSAGAQDHRPGADVPRPPRRRAGSSTTRSSSPAACRRCACCSGPQRPAAPTSPPSATS